MKSEIIIQTFCEFLLRITLVITLLNLCNTFVIMMLTFVLFVEICVLFYPYFIQLYV